MNEIFKLPINKDLFLILKDVKQQVKNYKKLKKQNKLIKPDNSSLFNI